MNQETKPNAKQDSNQLDYRALVKLDIERKPAPAVQCDFRIFVSEEAFDRICGNSEMSREVGGILVGEVLRDDNGPYVNVNTIIEALHAEEKDAELTLTHATWNHIHSQMDTLHTGKRIVGWYHTHPNFGIFLSDRDQFIQQSFFNLPFQVALVYDPVRREHGVFAWRDKKSWRVRQYWIGGSEHNWDSPREPVARETSRVNPAGASEAMEPAPADRQSRPESAADVPRGDLAGASWLLVAAVLGLLLGTFLGTRMASPTNMLQAREQAVRETIAAINTDLVSIIRRTLGDDTLWKSFDDGLTRLDQAVEKTKALEPATPVVQPALQSMVEAQTTLRRARKDRELAFHMLNRLEEAAGRAPAPETGTLTRELLRQRAALGAIYADLAQDALRKGDKPRATKLLLDAANVDPDHLADYQKQYQAFEPKGVFYKGQSGNIESRINPETPQPSPSQQPPQPGTKGNDRSKEVKAS